MTRALLPAMTLALATGCNPTVTGTLVDGMTGEPIAGKAADAGEDVQAIRIVADAVTVGENGALTPNPGSGMTCMNKGSEIGPDGSFTIADICLGATAYKVGLSDKNLFLGDVDFFDQGMDAKAPLTIKAWRAPNGNGVNILRGDALEPVRSRAQVRSETIKGTEDEKVYYPEALPKTTPIVNKGDYLVISGSTYADYKMAPVINHGTQLEFKVEEGMESGPKMQAWSYIGTSFTDSESFTRSATTIDEAKVVTVENRGHVVKFVPTDAVSPQGRQAFWKEGGDSAFIVDIGTAGADPSPAE